MQTDQLRLRIILSKSSIADDNGLVDAPNLSLKLVGARMGNES